MHLTEIMTDRLVLTPLSAVHSPGMFALWSSPEVCQHSGPAADVHGEPICLPARTSADSDKILDFFIACQRRGVAVRWAMTRRDNAAFVGAVGFNRVGACCELACHQHPVHWGKGLMTEACRAAIDWAATNVSAIEFEAFIAPANAASVRLIGRLGFLAAAQLRDGARRYVLARRAAQQLI